MAAFAFIYTIIIATAVASPRRPAPGQVYTTTKPDPTPNLDPEKTIEYTYAVLYDTSHVVDSPIARC